MRSEGSFDCTDPLLGRHLEGYLEGTLPPADAEAFESHYFSCRACLENLQLRQALPEALAKDLRERSSRPAESKPDAILLSRLSLRAPASRIRSNPGISAALGVAMIVGGYVVYLGLYRLPLSARKVGELQQSVTRLETELKHVQEESDRTSQGVSSMARSISGIVRLHSVGPPLRGSSREPVIDVEPGQASVLFAVELGSVDAGAGRGSVLLAITSADDRVVWSADIKSRDLREYLRSSEELVLAVPAAVLKEGRHTLKVTSQGEGQEQTMAEIHFRIVARR